MNVSGVTVLALALTASLAAAAAAAPLDWKSLKNPVLQYPDWSIKDYACAHHNGTFFVFFSAFYEDRGRVRSHVVEVTTPDFKTFSGPLINLDGREDDWIGMCSPELARIGDVWYLCYNSWGDKEGAPNQLFFRRSRDLVNWGPQQPLASNLTRGVRAIDAAVAAWQGKVILFWKEVQTTRCAVGDSLEGEFCLIGDGLPKMWMRDGREVPWNENYQILLIDGKWRLLVSTKIDGSTMFPVLYTMDGDGSRPEHWLKWVDGYRLEVPVEDFNTRDQANASALMLPGALEDGFRYLLYAGNTEGQTFLKRGHNRLGLARFRDLMHWESAGSAPDEQVRPAAGRHPCGGSRIR